METPILRHRFSKSPTVMEETLKLNNTVIQSKNHLKWCFINILLAALFLFNLYISNYDKSWPMVAIYCCQLFLVSILSVNALFHLGSYTWNTIMLKPVCLSPSQKKLMGIDLSERFVKSGELSATVELSKGGGEAAFTSLSPMNLSTGNWLFSSAVTEKISRNSLVYTPTQSWVAPPSPPYYAGEETISDETSLTKFLEAFDEQERRAGVGVSVESSPSSLGSFWNSASPRSSAGAEVSPLLRRCAYQVATISPVTPSTSPRAAPDDGASPVTVSHTEFWRRVKVDPNHLTQWNANLRMWISLTILQRVVTELDHIDAAFVRFGLSDLHLGSVGLDRLKRTACIPQVVVSIPSLPRLVPFLELSQHQEYLVTRIRELAKGGSMSEFRWNSGGSLHGKAWEEHLPTDASLVMHLISTYLDLQLVPAPQRPDSPISRPFSSQHFVRTPERPPNRPHASVIHQSQLNPPHFVLVDKDDVFDVPKGRNNVFHTFLLFLHLLRTREHGMLGPVNLGRSGVNVLWVVDS